MRASAPLGLALLLAFGCMTAARTEVRQCNEHRVDYLVGGFGKPGAGGRTCGETTAVAHAPVTSRAPAGAGTGRSSVVAPDDEGRRSILQQELDKTRTSLAALDRSLVLIPGAGTLAEQRARKVADISALEAELSRLK